MLLAATVLISVVGGGAEAKGGEIFLESASDAGPDPFSASMAVGTPTTVATTAPATAAPAPTGRLVLISTSGATPGLYGGTRDQTSCDAAQQVAFLAQNPDKAAAFASVLGIRPVDIPAYVATLTPVLLRADTRVTNNGFRNGVATPRQAVLQAGTAVLVDRYGVPRSKCACGNPLAPPKAVASTPKYNGAAWPGFQPNRVQVVQPSRTPVDGLVLVDPASSQPFARRVGTSGTADSDTTIPVTVSPAGSSTTVSGRGDPTGTVPTTVAAGTPRGGNAPPAGSAAPAGSSGTTARSSGTSPPPTVLGATITAPTTATTKPPATSPSTSPATSPPTTGAPTTTSAPKPPVDITSRGAASASSEYPGGAYPAHLAVDGNVTTSWFSAGGTGSTFTWTGPLATITEVDAISNRNHPEFPTGFGFGQVIVRVLRAGSVVFQQTVGLPGTPDPDVTVFPNVAGDTVALQFLQPEAPDCGGFAELRVKGTG
ncbi:MAG: hypothetical protein QOJ23_4862 [Actinomycetota bacterium]|nr:hypothetical protein [Actinomycetota bacterium]